MLGHMIPRPHIWVLFFLLFSVSASGQVLHHQMLGAQGGLARLGSAHYVSHSIGQQSFTGVGSSNMHRVVQGFQQSARGTLTVGNVLPERHTVTAYPNPFVDTVNFSFGAAFEGPVQVLVFDVSGRLVADRSQTVAGNRLGLELNFLSPGTYLVRLSYQGLTYHTKIIKRTE